MSASSNTHTSKRREEALEMEERKKSRRSSSPMAMAAEDEKKGAPLFENIFSKMEAILLLTELQEFRKKFGETKDWKQFHKMSELNTKYTEPQITTKMRRLKDKFRRSKGPPLTDNGEDSDSCIYELSQSLWGEARAPSPREARAPSPAEFPRLAQLFADDTTSPESLRKNPLILMKYEDAVVLEKQCEDIYAKEVELLLQKVSLKLRVGVRLLENIKEFAAESSAPGKDEQV